MLFEPLQTDHSSVALCLSLGASEALAHDFTSPVYDVTGIHLGSRADGHEHLLIVH